MLEARHTTGSGTVLAFRNLTVQEEREIDAVWESEPGFSRKEWSILLGGEQ